MRVFEAAIDGKKAWLKEYLSVSSKLGKESLLRLVGHRVHNKNFVGSLEATGTTGVK